MAAIIAAIIAALVGVLSLVIAKESKVSEFRQQWIDDLRKDISIFAGYLYEIQGGVDRDRSRDLTRRVNAVAARIRLHFKPDDPDAKPLLSAIQDIFSGQIHALTESEFKTKVGTVVRETQVLLRKEWLVVKKGEPIYRTTLRVGVVLLAMAVLLAAAYGGLQASEWLTPPAPTHQSSDHAH